MAQKGKKDVPESAANANKPKAGTHSFTVC